MEKKGKRNKKEHVERKKGKKMPWRQSVRSCPECSSLSTNHPTWQHTDPFLLLIFFFFCRLFFFFPFFFSFPPFPFLRV